MTKRSRGKVEKNWLEWVVFGVGLLLVLSTLAYLVYDGATAGDSPPDVQVRLGEPRRGGPGFLVPVTVVNRGGETAGGVTVEVVLEAAGSPEPERGEFTLAFLPRGGTREGWVAFRTDPRAGTLTARALGYEKP
ncbi:MAG TPA: hypothetical protein VF621_09795 [Pyrinomonadaceae bacterium]